MGDRIIDLQEIRLRYPDRLSELVLRAFPEMGQSDVAHLALPLEVARERELGAPVAQVVDLKQLELVGLEASQRLSELRKTCLAAG